MSEGKNSIVDLKKFFAKDSRPVSMDEFKEFWDSLTEEEKLWFKDQDLET